MAGKKISALPAATTPLTGTELVPVVQGGTTKKATVSDINPTWATLGDKTGASGPTSIALGQNAAAGTKGISIGVTAGQTSPGANAIAIGEGAGQQNQGANGVGIGYYAGLVSQGANSIAIGNLAGVNSQAAGSIVINATGSTLDNTTANSFRVAPIRSDGTPSNVLLYNTTSKEISYGTPPSTPVAPGLLIYNSLPSSYYSKTGTNIWQLSTSMEGGTPTTWTGTPSTKAVFVPRAFAKAFTMSRWGIRTTASSALTTTAVFRLIVYSDNNGLPGAILVDSGTFTPPSATTGTDVTAKYYWHNASYAFAAQTQYWFCFGFSIVEASWTPMVQSSSNTAVGIIARSQSAFATPTLTDIAYTSLSATGAITAPADLTNNPPTTFIVSNSQSSNNTPVFYFQSA